MYIIYIYLITIICLTTRRNTVPHHKQFKKSLKQNDVARLRNRTVKSRAATFVKKVKNAESREEAEKLLSMVFSVIDTTARKGIIKKQTAARKKSRLTKLVAKMN